MLLGYTTSMGIFDSFDEAIVRDLNSKLLAAQHAYYVLAAPIMTDAEYDTAEAQLEALVAAKPSLAPLATVLTTVGSDAASVAVKGVSMTSAVGTPTASGRIKHLRPMLSIENKYTKDDVVVFFLGLQQHGKVVCLFESKQDGISCELCYVNGHLKQAVTRGTGTEGEDMTAQVKALRSIPHFLINAPLLDMASEIRVRGELVMRDGELDRINVEATAKGLKTYASTRNLTAGTLKQKDLSVVASRDVTLIPWDMYSPTEDSNLPDSAYDRMRLLETVGFPQYKGVKVDKASEVIPAIDAILALNAKSDIRADGVVIKVDSHKLRRELGVASKFTNWMTCFKPQSASGTTYLRNIIWQGGRSGKLTPVAECDPVVLAGAVVTRATLNNETWIQTMGLTLGAKVEMLRSGDVIPQVTKVIDATGTPIIPPTECPECQSTLFINKDMSSGITTRFCENIQCPGRCRDGLSYVGSREILEIEGLADDMASKLVASGYARNIGELFQFQVEARGHIAKLGETAFTDRMSKRGFSVNILKMVKSMETVKTNPWDKWIAALAIPMIGRSLGKLLAKELKLESEDMNTLCDKLQAASKRSIEGLGDVKSEILYKWAVDPANRAICTDLYNSGVRPTGLVAKVALGVGQPLAGVSFIITGEFDEDRENLIRKLESLGGSSKSSVSKKCTHFIVGEGAGKSKLLKYEELVASGVNIQKVGKDWLNNVLASAGMASKNTFTVDEV